MSRVSEAIDDFEIAVVRAMQIATDDVTYYVDADRECALVPAKKKVSRARKNLLRAIEAER